MSTLVINQATDSRTGRPTRAPGRGYNTGHADQDLDDDEVDFEDESGDDIDDEDDEIGQGDRPARPRDRSGDRSTVGNAWSDAARAAAAEARKASAVARQRSKRAGPGGQGGRAAARLGSSARTPGEHRAAAEAHQDAAFRHDQAAGEAGGRARDAHLAAAVSHQAAADRHAAAADLGRHTRNVLANRGPVTNCACGGDQDMAPPAMDYGPRYRGPRIVTNRNPMAPPCLDFSDSPCANLATRRAADVRRDDFGSEGDKGRHLGMDDSDDDEDKAEGSNATARGSGSWAEALQYGKEGGMDDWEEDPVHMNYKRLGVLNAGAGDDSDMAPPVMDYSDSPCARRGRRS
jgi:hypothetical protein